MNDNKFLEPTEMQSRVGSAFACGVALAMLHGMVAVTEGKETGLPELDWRVRYSILSSDDKAEINDDNWLNYYLEVICSIIVDGGNSMEESVEVDFLEVNKLMSELLSLSLFSTMRLPVPPVVAVAPDAKTPVTVPEDWVNEAN